MASESMAADPVYSVAISLNTNTAKLLYIVEKHCFPHSPATGCSQAILHVYLFTLQWRRRQLWLTLGEGTPAQLYHQTSGGL